MASGITLDDDGALGFHLQAAALVDLVVIRADQLTGNFSAVALERYRRAGPFSLRRCGFSQLISAAPLKPR